MSTTTALLNQLVFFSLPNVANPKIIGFNAEEEKTKFVDTATKDHAAKRAEGWVEVPTMADWLECLPVAKEDGGFFLEFPETPNAKAYTHAVSLCAPDFKRRGLILFASEETKDEWIKIVLTFAGSRVIDNWLEVATEDDLNNAVEQAKGINGVPVSNYPSPDVYRTLPMPAEVNFCVDRDGLRVLLQAITFWHDGEAKRKEFIATAEERLGAFQRDGFLQVKDEGKLLEGDVLAASLGGIISFYNGVITQTDAMLPNPFSVSFRDPQGDGADITFKNLVNKALWVTFAITVCGARKVRDLDNYQCPTPFLWHLGTWTAKAMGAEVMIYPRDSAKDAAFPPIDFELATGGLWIKGSDVLRQLVFFPTSATFDDYVKQLEQKGIVVEVSGRGIVLTAEEDLATADGVALKLDGAYMDYPEEPEYHVMYTVTFTWSLGNSKNTLFFPTLATMNAFVCVMTKLRRAEEKPAEGWGIHLNVGTALDWEYGLQLASYLGAKGEDVGVQELPSTAAVEISQSSVGWVLADSPQTFRKITFDSEIVEANFQRFAIVHLGAILIVEPLGRGSFLSVRSRIAWEVGIFAARTTGGRVSSEIEESSDAAALPLPFVVNFCTIGFRNEQHILFPSSTTGEAFIAKMKAGGATFVLGWLQVLTVEKLQEGDAIAREMGGFIIKNPKVADAEGESAISVENKVQNDDASLIIFPGYLRQVDTARRAAFLFGTYDTQQQWLNEMLALRGIEKVGEWIEVPSTEDWLLGLKYAHDLGGRPMPVEEAQPEASSVEKKAATKSMSNAVAVSDRILPVLPKVYTHPVFYYQPGDRNRWAMVFSSQRIRTDFVMTMIDKEDANMIDRWLHPKDWVTGYMLAQGLGGIAVELPRGIDIARVTKYTHLVDYYQAGSIKGQVILFPTEEAKWRFEAALIGCWPGDARFVDGWIEAADASVWLDGLMLAKALGGVVLNMPEDRLVAN